MRRLLVFLFLFLPIAAQAQPATNCCKCYKGTTHTTENSFCVPAASVGAGCTAALAALTNSIRDSGAAGATLISDTTCDATVLTGSSCELISASSGSASAQCRITNSDSNALCSTLATLSHGTCPLAGATPTDTGGLSESVEVPFTPITPTLGVPIPGSTLSPATKEGGTVRVAFLAQYINGAYHYLTAIILVVAIVMCVYGAFLYLLGSGGVGSIQRGKEVIINSVMGMLITLAGYAILNTVNPNTVNLKVLDLAFVTSEVLEEPPGIEYGEAPSSSSGTGSCRAPRRGSSDTVYDSLFQRYAPCAGLDWRILKAIAYRESGFRECVTNVYGFTGLFQVATRTCALRNYGRAADCNRLTNPEVNTAAAAVGQLRSGAAILARRCPAITDARHYVTLLYYEHNSGPGALGAVITAAGCNATDDQYDAASAHFWEDFSERRGRALPPNYNNRMNYARGVADLAVTYGVTTPTVARSSCPVD